MKTVDFDYRDGDVVLNGVLAYDEKAKDKRPGVVVYPEAFGLSEHTIERAQMLVDLGYVALAADPYGGRETCTTTQRAWELVGGMMKDRRILRARARAAVDALKKQPQVDATRMGALGYCLGGTMVLELARDGVDLKGVICFHGNLEAPIPAQPGAIKSKILVLHGDKDPSCPTKDIPGFQDEMRAVDADWQVHNYGIAAHSFSNRWADGSREPTIIYNDVSDKRSWITLTAFFQECFPS